MPAATMWRQASLPDVEGGILAARKKCGEVWIVWVFQRALVCVRLLLPGWEARLYGRQGCLPLLHRVNFQPHHADADPALGIGRMFGQITARDGGDELFAESVRHALDIRQPGGAQPGG